MGATEKEYIQDLERLESVLKSEYTLFLLHP
jgi:hypothetical protein